MPDGAWKIGQEQRHKNASGPEQHAVQTVFKLSKSIKFKYFVKHLGRYHLVPRVTTNPLWNNSEPQSRRDNERIASSKAKEDLDSFNLQHARICKWG